MSKNINIGRDEAEALLDLILHNVKPDTYEARYLAMVAAQIIHKFGISASYAIDRWKGEPKALETFLYPLPPDHPSVRNANSVYIYKRLG